MKKPMFLSNMRIKHQLLFIYIFLIFVPISILGLYFISRAKEELLSQYEAQLQLSKNSVNVLLLDITRNNQEIINGLYKDQELLKLLETDLNNKELAQLVLNFNGSEHYDNNTSISSITFYTYNEQLNNFGNFHYIDSTIEEKDWFNKAKNQSSAFYIISPQHNTQTPNPDPELTFIQKITLPHSNSFAIAEIKTSNNFLKSRLKDSSIDIYFNIDGDYFYKDTPRDESFLNNLILDTDFFGIREIDNMEVLYTNYNFSPYLCEDLINVSIIDKQGIIQTNKIATNTYIIVSLVFLLTLILILFFIESFNRRVNILKHEVESVINDSYAPTTQLEGDDELAEVFNDLKTIFINVKKAEEEVLQSKITEQELINKQQQIEFKMLQSQINPHFLYNTLETIRMNALSSGNTDIATSIKLLGKSMRYVLENTIYSTTTLDKELQYVKTYIDIQNIRFDNNITYLLEYPPDLQLKEYQILPLLLQPIVENSILHGFVNTDYLGVVTIKIQLENDNLLFTISDNGVGLDNIEIEKLNISMLTEETVGNSIGIKNINKRLRIYYNSDGLKFDNNNNQFTVKFKIPVQRSNEIEIINL